MLQKIIQEQKQDSLGLLAGGVAHDFNNLLMAILGNADLALGELPHDSPARTSVGEIHAVALRAADLCQQMLIYSGRGNFNLQVVELNHLTNGLVPLLESIVPTSVTLHQELSLQPVFIGADFTRIQQVLLNLITNASEALAEMDGAITIETGVQNYTDKMLNNNHDKNSPEAGRYVYLKVSDTGPGMNPDTLNRLFDPFFTTKFAGRGLGLSVVLGIAKGHKGTILVDTESGVGSTFSVLFPESESQTRSQQPSRPKTNKNSVWKPKGLVLLADDEPDVLKVANRMLKKMGFEVMLAHDGEEAVEIFSDNSDIIDIVVLDLIMPRLGGREAMQRIKEISPGIPVLISSGYGDDRFLPGSPGYIQKPYTLVRLKEALRRIAEIVPD